MWWLPTSIWLGLISVITLANGECEKGCNAHTLIYDDLKCTPKYDSPSDCCPKEYDCSHIYNRPEGTCHLKGKFYKPGQEVDREDAAEYCHPGCKCSEGSEFTCPRLMDGCAEFWVGGYPGPGCYLKYDLIGCCAVGEICPPFDDNINCEANGVIYKEGLTFDHPTQKCTKCVCQKGFEGKFEPPCCQKLNCTEEMKSPSAIHDFCAPFYKTVGSCCPDSWICPSHSGKYVSASKPSPHPELHCKFGENTMNIGDAFVRHDGIEEITCECLIPPYLTCSVHS